ncbi:MAG: hypothetical protein ABIZ34_10695, partial [Candidatus Limnocylindrales bacterium]
ARTVDSVNAAASGGFSSASSLEVATETVVPWDEAIEGQVDEQGLPIAELLGSERVVPFSLEGAREIEDVTGPDGEAIGRVVRTRWPIEGLLRLSAQHDSGLIRLHVRVENVTVCGPEVASRPDALRRSLLGCHTLLAVRDGSFLSLTDPPPEAADAARACANLRTWPVLVGDEGSRDLLLSSPIILYDYPVIAPESQGDLSMRRRSTRSSRFGS